jgi:hypothetical protein
MLDTYGHLLPFEMDTLADRLELVRGARLSEPQVDDRIRGGG